MRLAGLFRRLGADRRGAIAVLFAVMFPVLVGTLGVGIETGIWYGVKRHNQSIADVAAYSGALQIAYGSGDLVAAARTAAKADAKVNGFDFDDSANTASAVTPDLATSPSKVEVWLRHQQSPLMTGYFGLPLFTIVNYAKAVVNSTASCASSLGSGGAGVSLNGTPAINMPGGCTITSNSTADDSIDLTGNASISAYTVYTAGGISTNGSTDLTLSAPPTTYAQPLPDPYETMSVPTSVTGFAMPTAATTFPTLPTAASAPPNNTHFAAAPSTQPSSICSANNTDNGSSSNNLNKSCYNSPGVQITGGTFTANKSPYYFTGPVTISGNVTMNSGVDVYIANGPLTITGSLTVASNSGKGNGTKAPDTIRVDNGSFDASAGTITFAGDNTDTSAYALQASGGIKFGSATFNGGLYSFYGSAVTLGASNHTTTLGAAEYYVDTGGITISSGGIANFTTTPVNSSTTKTTNLTINSGNLTSNGTLNFNNTNVSGVTYALQVPNGGSYALSGGSVTFGGNSTTNTKYGLYGGELTIGAGVNAGFNAGNNFYLDTGSFALNGTGCVAFQGGTSTLNLNSGSLTTASTSNLYFNPNGTFCGTAYTSATSEYTLNTRGNGNGITLGGPATFNTGTYHLMNSSNSGAGLTVNANTTFGSGIYSVQNGNLTINAGAAATLTAGTSCTPSGGASAGSCFYLSNGGTVNSGTMNLGAGQIYFQNGASTSSSSGFASGGTLNFTGGSGSNYHFYNGPAYGTGNNQGCSGGGGGGNPTYGALSLLEGSTTNLGPANYYAVNGALCMNQTGGAAATLSCANCTVGGAGLTFVLTGSSTANVSTLQIPGNITTSNLNAPDGTPDGASCALSTPGCYKGVLFLQDPMRDGNGDPQTPAGTISGQSCANHTNCSWLEGGDGMALTGAVYMPQSIVSFKANYQYSTSGCLVIISQGIIFTGNSTLTATGCTSAGVATLTSNSVSLTQ